MGYKFFLFTVLLFLGTFSITIYRSFAMNSALPTATPTLSPATPTTTSPALAIETSAIIALPPFTVTFPAPWSVLRPSSEEWVAQLVTVQEANPALAADLNTLVATSDSPTDLVLAWQPARETNTATDIRLVAAVMPADDLTLDAYLAAATTDLAGSSSPEGPGVTVKSASIRYDLHPEQLPVAVLHYEVEEAVAGKAAPTTGYQAVLLDATGTHLLLLTFIVRDAEPEPALAIIESIVATIQET